MLARMASNYDTTEFVDTDFKAHKAPPATSGFASLSPRAPTREEVDLKVTEAQREVRGLAGDFRLLFSRGGDQPGGAAPSGDQGGRTRGPGGFGQERQLGQRILLRPSLHHTDQDRLFLAGALGRQIMQAAARGAGRRLGYVETILQGKPPLIVASCQDIDLPSELVQQVIR